MKKKQKKKAPSKVPGHQFIPCSQSAPRCAGSISFCPYMQHSCPLPILNASLLFPMNLHRIGKLGDLRHRGGRMLIRFPCMSHSRQWSWSQTL